MGKTFYEILGVAENATPAEIEAAFKAKARDVHPDIVAPENAYLRNVAAEAFKDLSEAKAVLLDRTAREKYDAGLAYARESTTAPAGAPPAAHTGPGPQRAPSQAGPRAPRRVRRIRPPQPRTPRSTSSLLFMMLGLGAIFSLGAFVWSDRMPPFWLAAITACFGILSFMHGMRPKATTLIGSGTKPLAISAGVFVAIFFSLWLLSPPSDEVPLITRYVVPALAGASRAKASHPPTSAHGAPAGPTVAVVDESGEGAGLSAKIWKNLKDGQIYRTRLNADVLSLEAVNGIAKGPGEITSCEFHRPGGGSQNWIGTCSERNPRDQNERKVSATLNDFSEAHVTGSTSDIPVFVMIPVESAQTGAAASPGADLVEPDLSSLGTLEKQSIESACASDKLMEGPAAYNSCVRKQLEALKAAPKAPDLSHLSGPDRDGIELTCANAKLMQGPAAYNACLTRQVDLLKKLH
jgi:hypothetical protein